MPNIRKFASSRLNLREKLPDFQGIPEQMSKVVEILAISKYATFIKFAKTKSGTSGISNFRNPIMDEEFHSFVSFFQSYPYCTLILSILSVVHSSLRCAVELAGRRGDAAWGSWRDACTKLSLGRFSDWRATRRRMITRRRWKRRRSCTMVDVIDVWLEVIGRCYTRENFQCA